MSSWDSASPASRRCANGTHARIAGVTASIVLCISQPARNVSPLLRAVEQRFDESGRPLSGAQSIAHHLAGVVAGGAALVLVSQPASDRRDRGALIQKRLRAAG